MSIKDTTVESWSAYSGINSPADSERIGSDFADQIRNIKSVIRTSSLDKGFQVYTSGPQKDYSVTAAVDVQGSSLASLDLNEGEVGFVTLTLVGDKHEMFPVGQRILGISSDSSKTLMGEVLSCIVNTTAAPTFTVLNTGWDRLAYATTYRYEDRLRTASVGSQFGFDSAPSNGMGGKMKVRGEAKDDIVVPLRTFGFLDPVVGWTGYSDEQQVLSAFGVVDPALTAAYTSGYFLSLQVDSVSREKKQDGTDGAGAPNIGAYTVTRIRKLPDKFTFCLLDSPGDSGEDDKYIIYNWSISYCMRDM